MSAHTCQKQIFSDWGRSYSCGNKAKVERDGKHYCGVHDPVAQAEKRAAKNATYAAQMARASAARKAAAAAADEMARKAAAHDGLVVINAQLLAALSWFVMLQRAGGEDSNDCFERVGEVFHRDTGYLRPGKDCRLHSDEERTEAWDKWVQQHINAARAAIASATGEKA